MGNSTDGFVSLEITVPQLAHSFAYSPNILDGLCRVVGEYQALKQHFPLHVRMYKALADVVVETHTPSFISPGPTFHWPTHTIYNIKAGDHFLVDWHGVFATVDLTRFHRYYRRYEGTDTMTDEIKFFSASVLLIDPKTQLILGCARKDMPDNWGLPGGKIDPGEEAYDAAEREVFEETGIRAHMRPTPVYWGPSAVQAGDPRYCVTYLADAWDGEPIQQPGEGQTGWVTWQDLIDGVFGEYNSALRDAYLREQRRSKVA